jgi:hypothetical protein
MPKFIVHLRYEALYDLDGLLKFMKRIGALQWYCVAHAFNPETNSVITAFIGRWNQRVDNFPLSYWEFQGSLPIFHEYPSRVDACRLFAEYTARHEDQMLRSQRIPDVPIVLTEEQKQKKRERNRHCNMTPEQIMKHRERNRRKDSTKKPATFSLIERSDPAASALKAVAAFVGADPNTLYASRQARKAAISKTAVATITKEKAKVEKVKKETKKKESPSSGSSRKPAASKAKATPMPHSMSTMGVMGLQGLSANPGVYPCRHVTLRMSTFPCARHDK